MYQLSIQIDQASQADLERAGAAAIAVFERHSVAPIEAAEGQFALEGWDERYREDPTGEYEALSEEDDALARIWEEAHEAALAACRAGWSGDAPSPDRVTLEILDPDAPNELAIEKTMKAVRLMEQLAAATEPDQAIDAGVHEFFFPDAGTPAPRYTADEAEVVKLRDRFFEDWHLAFLSDESDAVAWQGDDRDNPLLDEDDEPLRETGRRPGMDRSPANTAIAGLLALFCTT